MIIKALPQFTYIQGTSFCLSKDACCNCVYYRSSHHCTLFEGIFEHFPSNRLASLKYAELQHDFTFNINNSNCYHCSYNTLHSFGECHFSSFMRAIGGIYDKTHTF